MNVLKSSWPRIAEFWFDEPLPKRGVDVAVLRQFSRPVPNAVPRPFHSIEIDLQTPEETLLKAMDADTRYEIRRAETKDQLEAEVLMQPSEALRQEFLRFHGAFAAEKNLQPATPALLDPLVAAGMLCLTRVLSQGEPLVWHSYVIAQGRARLLHSASLFRGGDNAQRNLVGRANRWLHWRDMMAFQSQGLRAYDMGAGTRAPTTPSCWPSIASSRVLAACKLPSSMPLCPSAGWAVFTSGASSCPAPGLFDTAECGRCVAHPH